MDIAPFIPEQHLQHRKIYAFFGKRETGKTQMAIDILSRMKFYWATAVSPTLPTMRQLGRMMPECCLHFCALDIELLNTFIDVCQNLKQNGKDREMLFFNDDCGFDSSIFRTVEFRQMAMNGRHLNQTHFWTIQFMKDLPCSIRTQIDWVFLMRDVNDDNLRKIHREWGSIIGKYEIFKRVFMKCTENYSALVIKVTGAQSLADSVFHYRADLDGPRLRIVDNVFWDMREEGGSHQIPDGSIHCG